MGLANERAEAVAIGKLIENMVGGLDFHALDGGLVEVIERRHRKKALQTLPFCIAPTARETSLPGSFKRPASPIKSPRPLRQRGKSGIDGLMSLFRVISGLGTYADFDEIRGLTVPGVGARTSNAFKNWGYRTQPATEKSLFPKPRACR